VRRHLLTIALILIFVVGLSVLLYPMVSDYFNSLSQSKVVAQYFKDLADLNEEDFAAILNAAHEYNQTLATNTTRFEPSDEQTAEYENLLNPTGNDLMGTLEIDKIHVRLPIYHGTTEGVLQIGVGHIEGTSLPVGGPGTHAALSGHRGLPSSTLLSDLDQMTVGDTFVLRVLNQVMTYQVDQILTVEPNDTSALAIETGKDYCTLVTCTPYGINTQRLLVRGRRIDNAAVETEASVYVPSEAERFGNITVAFFLFLPVLAILLTVRFIRHRKRAKRKV